eukprot:TRINITY_DN46847_c0_g1_i1.p1 TRINITY_DN46847_c0_g1~~TRINITY_DN46847_c0_g1_i1.p1  ORF type:complete len:728 (-),score=49.50 TRINITY_DN46847_c0_g1_i1:246-2429(-)
MMPKCPRGRENDLSAEYEIVQIVDEAAPELRDRTRISHRVSRRSSYPAVEAGKVQKLLSQLMEECGRNEDELLKLRTENHTLRRKLVQEPPSPSSFPRRASPQVRTSATLSEYDVSSDCNLPGALPESYDMSQKVSKIDSLPLRAASSTAALQLSKAWVASWAEGHSMIIQEHDECVTDTVRDDSEAAQYVGFMAQFIALPGSLPRTIWDLLGGVMILYDMIVVPLVVFSPPSSVFTTVMDWVTLVFWSLNVFSTCTMGYVHDGTTVTDPRRIVGNYLKTWFILDVITILPDWYFSIDFAVNVVEDSSSSAGEKSPRMLRILRLSRCVRLLRLVKLKKILQNIQDLFDSVYLSIVCNIVKMIVMLLAINHYIACAFYLLTYLDGSANNWVVHHGFETEAWTYKYAVAFHWSITQFTPASMHVQPQNLSERCFAILVVVFALVGFAYIIGSISTSLTKIRGMHEDTANQFWLLRKYLRQNKVPRTLGLRIQRYLEYAWAAQESHVSKKGAKIFALLSEQLNSELECASLQPIVKVHPLFELLFDVAPATMRRLCTNVVFRKAVAYSDDLFYPGEAASHMYIVIRGKLLYSKFLRQGDYPTHSETAVVRDWISEQAIWLQAWVHLGILTAGSDSEVLMIPPSKFAETMSMTPGILKQTVSYAAEYLKFLKGKSFEDLSDVSKELVAKEQTRLFMDNIDKCATVASKFKMNPLMKMSRRSSKSHDEVDIQ